ncbi:PQQ-like beta-propeller repeat protein [Haloterrigena sp. SYSU A558-1]|uniref:PQQ-like beta-propeller repeat protein n=1 Tax=Haloterrigena gelatinilytica TaxID=2741724 RepID=A0ABX2L9V6_9EURY|nr:PQQ-binding-like beta-propeller repeat protein [Haloterrigena gelatinilytica]NUC71133.1 PQQ-like beta-propeller repeat protein [Haloterrigena gelatinilytica]
MNRRSTSTRRRWLAACGSASVGIAGLSGCTGSDDSNDENGSSDPAGTGEEPDESGTEGVHNGSSGESWPMARFSANNGMVTDEWSGPDGPLEERWTVEIEDGEVSGPVVGHGFVYVADETSTLHAIDLTTGDVEWTYEPELPPETPPNPQWEPTTPAVTDDTVYFLTETLYALKPETGDVLWSVELGSLYSGDIRVYDGIVYVHNDGKLYAVDIEEQSIIWEERVNAVQDIAVGSDGSLYVSHKTNSGHDYEVVGFDVEKEEQIWAYSPSGNFDTGRELLVHDGTVYTHELDTVLAIDGETGEEATMAVYNKDDSESVVAGRAPTIANEIIYSAGVFDQPAVLTRELTTRQEPPTWDSNMPISGPTGRRIFVSKNSLYVWRGYGYVDLNVLNPETGEQRWSFDVRDHQDMVRGMVQGYAILVDSIIYSIDGNYSVIGALETA